MKNMASKITLDTKSLISHSDEDVEIGAHSSLNSKSKIVFRDEHPKDIAAVPSRIDSQDKVLNNMVSATSDDCECTANDGNSSPAKEKKVTYADQHKINYSQSSSAETPGVSEATTFIKRLGIMNSALAAADMDNLPDKSSGLTSVENRPDEVEVEGITPDLILRTGSQLNQPTQSASHAIWQMNYHEAAIYLQEGADNDKFDSHPSNRSTLPAYLLTHSTWFYVLDIISSLLLLILTVAERPAVGFLKDIGEGIHATIELFTLSVLGISIVLQLKWLGCHKFMHHTRSMIKFTVWLIMIAEAITVIIRNTSHFRATRALRPIFLLDNRYLGGVRRFMRQLIQSVPPVLEVVAVLMLVLLVFTTLGYYLFSPYQDPYFNTLPTSFVSLFVLLTTANYPDVMMPSYARSRWNAAFFITYLAITLYCIMNFMLAIVFVVFSGMEKDKFRKLLLHKRRACQLAFKLLVSRNAPNHITYSNFVGLLKYFLPKASQRDVYLIFKALNKSGTGKLSLNEFYQVYTACSLRWRPSDPEQPWYSCLPWPCPAVGNSIRKMVTSPAWEATVYLLIATNGVTLLVLTLMLSLTEGVNESPHVTWYQLVFISFYSFEVLMKIIGIGFAEYMKNGWNAFDFVVTCLSIAGVLAEAFGHAFYYIVILRPLRLLRLFRIRRRYREVFETMALLVPRVFSACIVITLIYYFFAIIGMEIFSQYDLFNCCVNSTVEQFYRADNVSVYQNYYYLNNFENIFMSGVTLFELTVVNNWFIIMEGYAFVSGEWSRIFFMLFYLVMMVVMSVVLAFILEAFTFRMQYNQTVNRHRSKPKCEVTRVIVSLSTEEVEFVYRESTDSQARKHLEHDRLRCQNSNGSVTYVGLGVRSKTALQLRMYRHLLHSWIRESSMQQQSSTDACNTSVRRRSSGRDRHHNSNVNSHVISLTSRVTADGVSQVVDCEQEAELHRDVTVQETGDTASRTNRLRQNSVASNLLEWFKSEVGEEEDHVTDGICDPFDEVDTAPEDDSIWELDEAEILMPEILNPPLTSTGSSVIAHEFCESLSAPQVRSVREGSVRENPLASQSAPSTSPPLPFEASAFEADSQIPVYKR